MPAPAPDRYIHDIDSGGNGPRPHRHLPHFLAWQVVHGEHGIAGKAFEQPLIHQPLGAAYIFFRRLKNQMDRAIEAPCRRKIAGRAEQHGGVPIMPAGVHLALRHRSIWEIGGLVDRKGIHVGANADTAAAVAMVQCADHRGARKSGCHLKAEARQFGCHHLRCAMLLESKFRMRMKVVAHRREIPVLRRQIFLDHRFCGTIFSTKLKAVTNSAVMTM